MAQTRKNAETVYGLATVIEPLVCYAMSHNAGDVMYYICRVFGVALPLWVAIPLRVALLTTGGHCLMKRIKELSMPLYQKMLLKARMA